jgi:hypothetical protein
MIWNCNKLHMSGSNQDWVDMSIVYLYRHWIAGALKSGIVMGMLLQSGCNFHAAKTSLENSAKKWWRLVLFFVTSMTVPVFAGQTEPTITFNTMSRVSTTVVANNETQNDVDPTSLQIAGEKRELVRQIFGRESSACGKGGRASQSNAKAGVELISNVDKFEILLTTDLRAQGGHYLAGAKLGGICIGGGGIDTTSFARGSAEATVELKFSGDVEVTDYWLDLSFESKATDGIRKISISDGQRTSIVSASDDPILLRGASSKTYLLTIYVEDNATDSGGCCNKTAKTSFRVSAKVRPASTLLLQSRNLGEFVNPERYSSVGIIISKEPNGGAPTPVCIGTIIGQSTLVTAAHCMTSFGSGKLVGESNLWFLSSASVLDGLRQAQRIRGWAVPIDYIERDASRKFVSAAQIENDIAVVSVEGRLAAPAILHTGDPPLELISAVNGIVTIVSYKPTVEGEAASRFALSWARAMSDARLATSLDKTSILGIDTVDGACTTESGAPVFISIGGQRKLVGLLVSGRGSCSSKSGPRIENHFQWLKSQIK